MGHNGRVFLFYVPQYLTVDTESGDNMSSQFNFYATNKDEIEISRVLLSVLGDFYIVPERGDKYSMMPELMSSEEDVFNFCNSGEMFAIIKKDYLELFQLDSLNNDLFRINYCSFPCLEFSRSIEVDKKTIALGRLAYFYDPKHPFISEVQKLFRNLKEISKRTREKSGYWIFGEASRCCKYLKICKTFEPSEENLYYQT